MVAGEKGLVWTEDAIVAYLNNPKVFLRESSGNPKARPRMAFLSTLLDELLLSGCAR